MKDKKQKKSYDLYIELVKKGDEARIKELIRNRDEARIKELIILLIKKIANKKFPIRELYKISYIYDDIVVLIPMHLGWKDDFIIKDKWLNEALLFIVNLEGDTIVSASKKAKDILKKL